MTPQEMAQNTLDLLERDGWCKNSLFRKSGERCVVGAALRMNNGTAQGAIDALARMNADDVGTFYNAAMKVISEQFPERRCWDLVVFNNHPDTTFDDIRMVLEKVIAS